MGVAAERCASIESADRDERRAGIFRASTGMALQLMKPPGKTTLTRMQHAAQLEAERIEITQDARVQSGDQAKHRPSQIRLRDDFAGIVRLIDMIQSDAVILER